MDEIVLVTYRKNHVMIFKIISDIMAHYYDMINSLMILISAMQRN